MKTKKIVFSALFAALILGAIQIHVQMPMSQGYVHLGDSIIYLAAAMLPFPYGAAAAGIGGALADIIGGYAYWAFPTLLIKFLMACTFTSKSNKILNLRNCTAVGVAGVINIVGYYIAECLLYRQDSFDKTLTVALGSVWGNVVQSVGSALLFFVIAFAFDRAMMKKHIGRFDS